MFDEQNDRCEKKHKEMTMTFRKISAVAAVAVSMLGVSAMAQTSTWTIDSAHSSAQFSIRHLGVSKVHGSITGIKGTVIYDEKDPTKSKVEATLDANTVNTANDGRDKHLKSPDFFDVEKNPTLTFKSTGVTKVGGKLQMVGNLTLAGVTKPITLTLEGPATPTTARGKTVSGFSATGIVHRADFNFGSKYSSPMLGDDVDIEIDIEVSK